MLRDILEDLPGSGDSMDLVAIDGAEDTAAQERNRQHECSGRGWSTKFQRILCFLSALKMPKYCPMRVSSAQFVNPIPFNTREQAPQAARDQALLRLTLESSDLAEQY